MTNFSTDADLLKWEPALLRECTLDHQRLTQGDGASSQTFSVMASTGGFVTNQVQPGHVIHLRNAAQGVDGYYEVFSIESETELLAGVIGGQGGDWVPLPTATDLEFAIHTFDPQHEEARHALLSRFGLEADAADAAQDLERWIVHRRNLRRASVALVLSMLYRAALACVGSRPGHTGDTGLRVTGFGGGGLPRGDPGLLAAGWAGRRRSSFHPRCGPRASRWCDAHRPHPPSGSERRPTDRPRLSRGVGILGRIDDRRRHTG